MFAFWIDDLRVLYWPWIPAVEDVTDEDLGEAGLAHGGTVGAVSEKR